MRSACLGLAVLLCVGLGCDHEAVPDADNTAQPVAIASRAGVYDGSADAKLDPTHLNWTVEGTGCISYPHPGDPRVSCNADEARWLVKPVLCQQ